MTNCTIFARRYPAFVAELRDILLRPWTARMLPSINQALLEYGCPHFVRAMPRHGDYGHPIELCGELKFSLRLIEEMGEAKAAVEVATAWIATAAADIGYLMAYGDTKADPADMLSQMDAITGPAEIHSMCEFVSPGLTHYADEKTKEYHTGIGVGCTVYLYCKPL